MPGSTAMRFFGLPITWNGTTVSCVILGLYAGDYVVQQDTSNCCYIDVPYAADTGGLLTATYIYDKSQAGGFGPLVARFTVWYNGADTAVTVPVVIGFKYTTQGQSLPPDMVQQERSPEGPGTGKQRRLDQFAAKLGTVISGQVYFGTDFVNMFPADFGENQDGSGPPQPEDALWSGVYRDVIDDAYTNYGGQLAWSISTPYPVTVVSLTGFLSTGEI